MEQGGLRLKEKADYKSLSKAQNTIWKSYTKSGTTYEYHTTLLAAGRHNTLIKSSDWSAWLLSIQITLNPSLYPWADLTIKRGAWCSRWIILTPRMIFHYIYQQLKLLCIVLNIHLLNIFSTVCKTSVGHKLVLSNIDIYHRTAVSQATTCIWEAATIRGFTVFSLLSHHWSG